jgi:trehalose 6-phosphate synthase/phosphatase
MSSIIIVSNRLPVSVKKTEDGIELYPSAGGLATAMSSYASKKNNLWIGWPGIDADDLTEKDKRLITKKLADYNCAPVFLTKKQVDDFYNGYSNTILWPFFHSMEADFTHEARFYKAYREVNELFHDALIALTRPGATVWVHDYQLLLLPEMLRKDRPGDSIGFFLHIPFPPIENFRMLNHAGTLLRGILGADLAGFHTKNYVSAFLDACQELTSATPIKGGVALKERAVRVADFPIGIDYVKFAAASREKEVQRELHAIQRKYKGKKIILTVDRLDPTKGFMERLDAYETFLTETPALHGKVVMLMLAVPSRGEVEAYRRLKVDVEAKVKSINKQFGNKQWKPVAYMYKSVSFEVLNALYQAADVAFVAPIRDGMNLVAKEYVASQNTNKGILILSETAGAAQELRDALLVSHEQPRTLVSALKKAIDMPRKELKKRVTTMQNVVSLNTVQDWAGGFMSSLSKPITTKQVPYLNKTRTTNLISNAQGANYRLFIFDYDGVLVPFKDDPAEASPSSEVVAMLKRLAEQKRTSVVVISGRSLHDLDEWLGHLPITLVAEHGAMIRRKGSSKWQAVVRVPAVWKKILKPALQKHATDTPGAFVEEKNFSLVWHYRNATPYYAQKNIAILKTALKPALRQYGLQLHLGNKILEVKRPENTKGKAVKALLNKPYDFILALGDDYTDEDTFKALPRRAFTIKVGRGSTRARYRMKTVGEVQSLIKRL